MYRGSISLFDNIFQPAPAAVADEGPSLRQRKVKCLIDYYYYKGRETNKSYPYLLQMMSDAFFLSERTIADMIQMNIDDLKALKRQWSDSDIAQLKKHMQNKWPHLAW